MYKGLPVGYLLFWFTGAEMGLARSGPTPGNRSRLLIVDGQQQLTSLFAVTTGTPIVTKNNTEGRIRIAFRPEDARFEVTDAAIERDPEFIAEITEVWRAYRQMTRRYLARLKQHRDEEIDQAEEDRLEGGIDRVRNLAHYPFKAVEIDSSVDEERVADIFVRINSEGVTLKQGRFYPHAHVGLVGQGPPPSSRSSPEPRPPLGWGSVAVQPLAGRGCARACTWYTSTKPSCSF